MESYDHAVTVTDRAGEQVDGELLVSDHGDWRVVPLLGGHATMRLPRGRYSVLTVVAPHAGAGEQTLVAKPQMNLDHASPIALDARQGKPVTSTVERSGARPNCACCGSGPLRWAAQVRYHFASRATPLRRGFVRRTVT